MKSRGKTAWIPFYVERGYVFPSDDLMLTVKLKLEEIKKKVVRKVDITRAYYETLFIDSAHA